MYNRHKVTHKAFSVHVCGVPTNLHGVPLVLVVKGVRDNRGLLGGPTDTTLCITHTSVAQDTCS